MSDPTAAPPQRDVEWFGISDRSLYAPELVAEADRLADAAKAGAWSSVLEVVDGARWIGPNQWRIGGASWFSPLHQAAWHGAPVDVVGALVERGAWRSLRESEGRRAVDLARARGHDHLVDALDPGAVGERPLRRHEAWDGRLRDLIDTRTRALPTPAYRPVPTEVLVAEPVDSLWFGFPGMYGGFALSVHRTRLHVESWNRVVGGSGQAHVITDSGCVLVEDGFV